MRNFFAGFLSVLLLSSVLMACTNLEGSTQSNSTTNTVTNEFGDFDIL